MVAVTLTATFTTAGPFTWTCPAGVTSVVVACTGAGGSGGNAGTTSGSNGGGGGGGEAALNPAVAVTPGLGYSGTVGAGGAAGATAVGGDTSFTGDSATVTAHGGGHGGTSPASSGVPGAGGTGSVNLVSASGGPGDMGTAATNGGGGGGAAGVDTVQGYAGNPGSGSTGGAASAGAFPGGAGGTGSTSGAGPGGNGVAPGGGGGGALSTGTGRNGGAGANGQVVITWTQNDPVTLSAATAGGAWAFTAPAGSASVKAEAWGGGAGGFNLAGNAPSGGGRAGSTVWQVYGITDRQQRVQAADIFDGYVGVPIARQAQKVYYNETGSDSIAAYVDVNHPQAVGKLAAVGCQIVLCPKANRSYATGTDDFTALQSAVADIRSQIGAPNLTVVLWQECTDNWFPSAAAYLAYWNHYAPAIPSDVLLAVDVGAGPGLAADQAYCQAVMGSTVRKPDVIAVDVYDSSYSHGRNFLTYPPSDPNYPGVADMADILGVPFGIYEWGQSASASYTETAANWQSYIYGTHGLLTVIQNRFAAGQPMHHVMYYGGSGPGNNDIESSTDFRIPAIVDMFSTMAGGQAVGGAGGGGGEYAAESSLVITGGRSYVLAVGAGGAGGGAGASSTVAGDSVTVTGHGGSVATVTSAGGAAGTGSSNTTHHDGGAGGAGGIAAGGGGGGGGSGGTAAAGNAGAAGTQNFGGAGGAAVTGGGQGGFGAKPNIGGFPGQSPGGGGGGGGAAASTGAGSDGQIALSSFVTGPGGSGGLALAPLGLSGAGKTNAGSFSLAPATLTGTGNVSMFQFVQAGPTASGTFTLSSPSKPGSQGSTLFAFVVQSTQSASTPPAGQPWQLIAAMNAAGASGRAELWMLPGPANPGGITSATFTGGTALRGYIAEFTCPPGYIAQVDQFATGNYTAPSTSFAISILHPSIAGDLALALFEDQFSSSPSGSSWTTPPAWTRDTFVQQSVPDCYVGYHQLGIAPGSSLSVTGTFSTSTNQTGAAAILATFTAVPSNVAYSGVALAPLALSGTGAAVVPAGTVATSGGLNLAPVAFQSPSRAVTFPQQQLPVMVELFLNGVWTDITSDVYVRDGITIGGKGRPDEASTAQPAQVTLTLNNRAGNYSPANTAGPYYPYLARNTQIRISVVNAVTPQGSWYSGYRFWGEVPAWPVRWDISGNDVYVTLTCAGVLQRMQQSRTLGSALRRYYNNYSGAIVRGSYAVPALAAYWPCEDGTSATSFASGIPGGSPMTWTGGTPGLAADTGVTGSAPLATTNSTVWTGTPGAFSTGGITFTTPGTYTWTCPANVTTVLAECWGAGGGGASGINGAGGAGGEYAAEPALAVTPGQSYAVVVGSGGSGGDGTFSTKGTGGTAGGNSTFKGNTVTVRANGGAGAPAGSSGHASGGSGSTNSVHHSGGNGASASNHFGGDGGGSSAGSAGAGNTGKQSNGTPGGNGGAAVTNGGPGGTGGTGATAAQGNAATPGLMPVPGPGGGGGGGGFSSYNNYGKPGGGGQAGQVRVSFGAQIPMPPANVLRVVTDIPAGGGVDGAILAEALTSGTVAKLDIVYHTVNNGSLALIGKNSGGGTIISSGTKTFGITGQPMLVSAELTQQTATQIAWKLTAITPGAAAAAATFTGTVAGTLGSVTQVNVNNAAGATDTASGLGHVAVAYVVDPILNLAPALGAYAGELAATRFLRLCGEQNVPAVLQGSASDTPQMGPQPIGLLISLLQECEDADKGLIYELRDAFGLGYRTRVNLQNQAPDAVADYSAGQVSPPLEPTDDDQLTRNDIVATRTNGSSYEAQLTTGDMSTLDPPGGVGLYSYPVTVNLFADTQLAAYAAWLLILGTVDEFRYPAVTFDLRRAQIAGVPPTPATGATYAATYAATYSGGAGSPGVPSAFGELASLAEGDHLQIINPPPWLPQVPIDQLCFGFTETLNVFEWVITINTVPESPYESAGSALPAW